jgi:signal transduction histidine kinase
MSRWKQLLETGSIRLRLQAAVLLLAALPTLVLLTSFYQLDRMSSDARHIALAGGLRTSAFIVAAQLNSHLANPADYKWEIVQEELRRMEEALTALEQGSRSLNVAPVTHAEVKVRIAEARHAMGLYRQVTADVHAHLASRQLPPERLEAISQEVLGSAYGFLALSNLATQSLETHARAAVGRLQLFQGIAVAVAFLITLLTVWAIRRFVLGPIPSFFAAFSDVQEGRYGAHVAVQGENEFAHLARAFNSMSESLEQAHRDLVFKQTEILEKNTELERASRLKSQFVSNMSHELRTPLNAIMGYTRLLSRGVYGEIPEKMQEPLHGIDETSKSLLQLINDILDVAKIEAGRMDLYVETMRIEEVVREVGEILRPLAIAKGLELTVDADASVQNVTSDRDKIRRILVNLGANAVKFTRRGRVALRLLPEVEGSFAVEITDSGIGIAPGNLDAIFEDFRQLEDSHTREHEGTGLGLAISRRLARHLGGDIEVSSVLGQGSTFTLRLPLFVRVDGDAGSPALQPASESSEAGPAGPDSGGAS